MLKNLKQQNGFSLIGILVVVVIIAALAYGSSFFWSKNTEETKSNLKNTIDIYNQAQQDLSDISQKISEKNELLNETAGTSSPAGESGQDGQQTTDEGDLLIEGWSIYEKPEMNVRLKYHKDWYYDRDEQAEKDLSYDLYVGFAESPEVLAKGRPYPIEFMIMVKDHKFPLYYSGYIKTITTRDDKKFVLQTGDQIKYKDILDKMVESFEFLKK